jgi:hypothetical protein
MNNDLALDELRAAALPWDFAAEIDGTQRLSTCVRCCHLFLGKPSRSECRECVSKNAGNLYTSAATCTERPGI